MSNVPQWASKKSKPVQRVAIETFNSTLKDTGSEEKARIASLAAMKNAEKAFSKKKTKKATLIKSTDEFLKQVTYVAMKEGTDLHGDYVDFETIRLAKESFNRQLKKANMANLYHIKNTNSFDIIESYLAPCDMNFNENFVQKGEWLVTLQIFDNDLWDLIVKDEITGVSIGALANTYDVEE